VRSVNFSMARYAESDQVFLDVTAERASKANMMDLKIARTPTRLTSPSIAFEHLAAELPVGCSI